MGRPRHQDKDLEQLIRDLEKAGWTVAKGRKYYKARCPCSGHQAMIKCTPSNPNWAKEKRKHLKRTTCWE